MTLLGLDFDNTLVHYDKLFHQIALEKGLINQSMVADKVSIRDYLRSQGKEEQFTLLQGEIYGLRILEAEPAKGMLESLKELHRCGISMVLISHKTKTPYKGQKYDLHKAARNWLEKYNLTSKKGLGWSEKNIFFEQTKKKKIERIISLGCTHYIDDLEEILDLLPESIKKIHYNPKGGSKANEVVELRNWEDLQL